MVCCQNRGMILMLILALSVAVQDHQMAPDGLRLALGLDPSAMRIAWQTYDVLKAETKVMWGSKADSLDHTATGGATVFTSDPARNWTMHTAEMTGLAPSSQYFYKVGGSTGWSEVFQFKSQANADTLKDQLPQVMLSCMPSCPPPAHLSPSCTSGSCHSGRYGLLVCLFALRLLWICREMHLCQQIRWSHFREARYDPPHW